MKLERERIGSVSGVIRKVDLNARATSHMFKASEARAEKHGTRQET